MSVNSSLYGKRLVVLTVAVGLVAMALFSFVYRLGAIPTTTSRPATQSKKVGLNDEQNVKVRQFMEMLQKNPESTEALSGLGDLFLQAKVWDKSASFWERYLKLKPKDEEAIYHYAIALLNMDKINESAEQFESLVQVNPESFHGYYYLGMINVYYLNDKVQGKAYLEKVLDMNPDHPELLENIRNELKKMSS